MDVGVRVLATVANSDGEIIERVSNPRPLETALKELRHLSRRKPHRSRGSRRYIETTHQNSRLHRRVADIRGHHIHCLVIRLVKTHGEIEVEELDAAGMIRQKGLTGARTAAWAVRLGTE
jgi:putative transposase